MTKENRFYFDTKADMAAHGGFMRWKEIEDVHYRGFVIYASGEALSVGVPNENHATPETADVPLMDQYAPSQPLDHIHLAHEKNRVGTTPATADRVHRDTWSAFVARAKKYIDSRYQARENAKASA